MKSSSSFSPSPLAQGEIINRDLDSFRKASNPCRLPALRIRFQPWPSRPSHRGQNAPAAFLESWARDRTPLWQRDMPSDWWLIGTGGRLRFRCLLLDRRGGALEGGCCLLLRTWTLTNIRRCLRVGTWHIGHGRRQSLIGFDYSRWRGDEIGETPCHGSGE
jgi:hypothetical protein